MIQLLFLVVFAEATVAILLMVKIGPLRELVMNVLDQVKTRKATVLTIAGTICAILFSNSLNIVKIHSKGAKVGTMTPMDQVLWRTQLLETSLMGFCLFLGFLIERMHYHLRKFSRLKSSVGNSREELERLEKEKVHLREIGEKAKEEIKALQKEIFNLTEDLKKLKVEAEEKEKRVVTAESHVAALQKQSADLLLEYDRLLEDNQNLQKQAMGYRR